jgi:hypothetical protein
MDSLISEARTNSVIKRPRSQVLVIADMMPDDLRAEFAAALADPDVTAPGLTKALQARGFTINKASIQHWREMGHTL